MIVVRLRGTPRAKERPRTNMKTQVVYTPKKTVDYESALRFAAGEVMASRPPLEGPLVVDILIEREIPVSWPEKKKAAARLRALLPASKPDWENYAKMIDALNLIVWVDDGQIVDGRVRKVYSETPGMTVRVDYYKGEMFS